jgi:hypothetical protein
VHVDKVQLDAQIQDLIIVVHHLILDLELVEDVMFNNGQNLLNTLIDMIKSLKINVKKLIVGNLMTFQALINVLTQIIKSFSALD